ncbi:tail completion protein gp17 [Sphingomonas adhaesiva]|uniref:tail completion protein gp17 n=1 Tax=Sphingomonas adhaesiva TaxID=28212 RepID=UPI002FFAB325
MTGIAELRAAILARLRGDPAVAAQRVVEGAAARAAAVPFVVLRDVAATDWGTKDRGGREVRVSVAVRDEGESGARAAAIGAAVEASLLGLPSALGGWRVVTVVPVRNALLHEGGQRWAALVDVRVRMLEEV